MTKVNEEIVVEKTTPKKTTKKELLKAVVNCSRLNVRKGPSINDDIIKIIDEGTEVVVTGEKNEFYAVKTSEVSGYCMKEFLTVS